MFRHGCKSFIKFPYWCMPKPPEKEAMTLCPESLQIFKKSLQACRGMKNLCRDYCRSKNYNRKECQIYLPCCKLLDSGVLNLQPLFKYLVRLSEKSLQRLSHTLKFARKGNFKNWPVSSTKNFVRTLKNFLGLGSQDTETFEWFCFRDW